MKISINIIINIITIWRQHKTFENTYIKIIGKIEKYIKRSHAFWEEILRSFSLFIVSNTNVILVINLSNIDRKFSEWDVGLSKWNIIRCTKILFKIEIKDSITETIRKPRFRKQLQINLENNAKLISTIALYRCIYLSLIYKKIELQNFYDMLNDLSVLKILETIDFIIWWLYNHFITYLKIK